MCVSISERQGMAAVAARQPPYDGEMDPGPQGGWRAATSTAEWMAAVAARQPPYDGEMDPGL
jgi:hypothetical protein